MSSHSILDDVAKAVVYRKSKISFTCENRLGAGAFGEVFKAREDLGKRTFAVKYINCRENNDLQNVIREISMLINAKHENIVKIFDFGVRQIWQMEVEFHLILEYCSFGCLNDHLGDRNPAHRKLRWIRGITSAIVYLHDKGIVHQDLKPDNILLNDSDVVKVADFGLAQRFAHRREGQSWRDYYIEEGVGQRFYVAPEMLRGHHNYKVDIFSLGIVFHTILEGMFTKIDGKTYYAVVVGRAGKPIGIEMYEKQSDINIPFRLRRRKLIKEMMRFDPGQRPTARQVQNIVTSRIQRWKNLMF